MKPEKNVTKGLHIHLKLPKIVLFVAFNLFVCILYISEPVVKHSSGKTDIEFEIMDLLELTSSQEHLLFEAVCNVSSDVPIVQSEPTRTVANTTRRVKHKTQVC